MPYNTKLMDQMCELAHIYADWGWMRGTSGGMSVADGKNVYMIATNVDKRLMIPDDIVVLGRDGKINLWGKGRKPSSSSNVFLAIHELGGNAVIHPHDIDSYSIGILCDKEADLSGEEMKGIGTYNRQTGKIPIIGNKPQEKDLEPDIRECIERYPESRGIIIRRHGIYVWGDTLSQAARHTECYNNVFQRMNLEHRDNVARETLELMQEMKRRFS